MKLPTIHRNGTPRDRLLEQVTEARQAVFDAMEKLKEASPNARDYYPQGERAFVEAQDEWRERYWKLQVVWNELGEIALHIAEAPKS